MFEKNNTKKIEALNKEYNETYSSLKKELLNEKHKNQLKILSLEKEHELQLKEKEFELNHFKDEEVKKLSEEVSEKKQEIAVLKKENEMLGKITNLNADIIDVKDLVVKLIDKLPNIDLKSLTINNTEKQ